MKTAIRWDLLRDSDLQALSRLGVDTTTTSALKISRKLSIEELTYVLAFLLRVERASPKDEGSHIKFAIGDCLLELKARFGKKKTEEAFEQASTCLARWDALRQIVGGTLIYLQCVEHLIAGCCAMRRINGLKLTIEDVLSNDASKRTPMLHEMRKALRGRLKSKFRLSERA